MKKTVIIMVLVLLLSGCNQNNDRLNVKSPQIYDQFHNLIDNNFMRSSDNLVFNSQLKVKKIKEGYEYRLVINKPQIVMRNIKAMVLTKPDDNKIAPNIGITNDKKISLVPNQVNVKLGFPKTFVLKGKINTNTFNLTAVITFKDENDINDYRYFVSYEIVDGKIKGE